MFFSIFMIGQLGIGIYTLDAAELDNTKVEEVVSYVEEMSDEEYELFLLEMQEELEVEFDGSIKNERAIAITAILSAAAKIFGKAAVAWVSKKILDMGLRGACRVYNDYNRVWDFVCDAANQYRD